ncbi:hypothetical protein HRbin22_00866 [Candidatus Thermoflexus japonica]|uniref:Uncharacterized protein n=1 Tax=Candidatus Thermoflexus japonica TaxID=2035417 RepID=A0A2H5Y5B0_9CHLR|nr:hypothetical protein HRbin22_00866 [Candidatus Thermoflexus japonica]
MRRWVLFPLGIIGLLIGCGRGAPSSPSASPSPAATAVPTSASPSPWVTAASSPIPSAHCGLPFQPSRSLPSVDLLSLTWTTQPFPGLPIRLLGPSLRPLLPWGVSPDGRWLVIASPQDELRGLAEIARVARHPLNRSIWLNRSITLLSPLVQPSARPLPAWTRWQGWPWTVSWLKDGTALWVNEEGQIEWGDGTAVEQLPAPAPLVWIEGSPSGQGFARDTTGGLWRFDLPRRRWEPVTPAELQGSTLGGWGPDHTWFLVWTDCPPMTPPGPELPGATWQGLRFWRVPLREDQPARRLGQVVLPMVGTDAWMPPHQPLEDGSRWILGLPLGNGGIGALVDVEEGRWWDAAALGLPPGWFVREIQASPRGGWVAIHAQRQEAPELPGRLILRSAALQGSSWEREGMGVVAWHPEDRAVVLGEGGFGPPDTLAPLRLLPLPPTQEPTTLGVAGWPIAFTQDRVVAVDRAHPARVLAFDLEGHLRDTLDLSGWVERVRTLLGAGAAVYLDVGWTEGEGCRYGLIEWIPR